MEAYRPHKSLIRKGPKSNSEIWEKYFVSSYVLKYAKTYKGIDRVNILNEKELLKVKVDSLNRLLKTISTNGGWNWFGDRDSNFFVTLYILDGFRKLKEIGIRSKVDREVYKKEP